MSVSFDVIDLNAVLETPPYAPIVGGLDFLGGLPAELVSQGACDEFVGLLEQGHCLEKAQRAQKVLDRFGVPTRIMLGAIQLASVGGQSFYGFEYHPPYEFHAWLETPSTESMAILDFSLPGVIKRGLSSRDEIGPFLVGRTEVILMGQPLSWMCYSVKTVYDGGN